MYVINLTLSFAAGLCSAGRLAQRSRMLRLFFPMLAGVAVCCLALLSPSVTWAQLNNTIATVAGGALPNSTATLADIPGPTSAAEDASGNIYIAAPYSYYVFKVNPATNALSVFAGTGIYGFSGDGSAATLATLEAPAAVAVDPASGNVYIADNNRIRVVTPDGNINTFAGAGQRCSPTTAPCGDGGAANQAYLNAPQALVVDGSGNLFMADTGDHRIREVSGGIISTVAGSGKICDGPTQACGDGGAATQANLDLPAGVALDGSGNIYIGDTRDQRIRLVTKSSGNISTYAGSGIVCTNPQGSCGDGSKVLQAQFANPSGVSLDSYGNLYIADQLDNKIRAVTAGAASVITVAGNGVQGFADGPSANAEFDEPLSVVIDSSATLTVGDTGNERVRQIANVNVGTVAGGGSVGDGNLATLATLANPITVAWDPSGTNYYIADAANNRIRKVASNGTISTVAGNGQMGWSGDGGSALSATLNSPNGVLVDSVGNIFIADTGNLVVRKVDTKGNITTFAGSGEPCEDQTGLCGDGNAATKARITFPTSLAMDGAGNVYIADYYGNRIRMVDTSGIIHTAAGTGARGFGGDGGPATSALLNRPYGIAVDSSGNLYIADSNNNRIRCVVGAAGGCDGSTYGVGTIFTYAFNGKTGFRGNGGLAKAASRQDPLEVALDPTGNLFVGGGADLVVSRIDAATGTVTTVAGNNQLGFGGDGGSSIKATLDNLGLSVSGSAVLLIADEGNNRIRQVDMVPGASLSSKTLAFPTTPVGQTSAPLIGKLKNTGLADLPINSVSLGGADPQDFTITGNTCVTVVAPHLSCSVTVTFTPTKKGARKATVEISTGLGARNIKLTGTGE